MARSATVVDPIALEGLATSPSGERHTIRWDSLADAGFRGSVSATLRLTPRRGAATGSGLVSNVPAIDNLREAARRVDQAGRRRRAAHRHRPAGQRRAGRDGVRVLVPRRQLGRRRPERRRRRAAFNLDGSPGSAFSRTLILVDADDDAATGYQLTGALGSELLVAGDGLFGQAAGQFNTGLVASLAVAPTTAAQDVALAIPLAAVRAATPDASRIRLLFVDDKVFDYAPDASALVYRLVEAP